MREERLILSADPVALSWKSWNFLGLETTPSRHLGEAVSRLILRPRGVCCPVTFD